MLTSLLRQRCTLHIHGYTERRDPRATYSSPSAVGLMLAVGNVGEHLLPYADSDTFLTRDGGFTWEEVHKDAHVWEYGDQGSILLLANDEDATDHVTYSLNEGLSWQDYNFGERIRVKSIVTVPMDTSRKFILFGTAPNQPEATVAIHLDFSSVTNVKCMFPLRSIPVYSALISPFFLLLFFQANSTSPTLIATISSYGPRASPETSLACLACRQAQQPVLGCLSCHD